MRDVCLDDFLMKFNPNHLERHSDSSDFESPRKIPIVASKDGNHKLLTGRKSHSKHEKHSFNNQPRKTSVMFNMNRSKMKTAEVSKHNKKSFTINNRAEDDELKHDNLYKKLTLNNINKNHGDPSGAYHTENVNSKNILRSKAMLSMSTILKRRNNCTKHMSIIEEDQATKNNTKVCELASLSNCERQRKKRIYKHRRGYSVQPVYNVEEKIQGFPFTTNNDKAPSDLHDKSKNNGSDVSNDLNLSSTSDLETANRNKSKRFQKKKKSNARENMQEFSFIANKDETPIAEFNEMPKNNGTDISNDLNVSSKSDVENINIQKLRKFLKKKKINVENNIQGFTLITSNDKASLSELNEIYKNNGTDNSNELNVTSKSDIENIKPYTIQQYKMFLKKLRKSFEKEKLIDDLKYDPLKNHQQQYPSKFQMTPYQIFSTSSCQAKCSACESENSLKVASSSSFWDFFARKMKNKIQKPGVSKSCDCVQPLFKKSSHECSPENCEKYRLHPENPDFYNHCQKNEQNSSQTSNSSKKKSKEPKVICKCYPKKKKKDQSKKDAKPCQENHDKLTEAIAQKYNGEILCIHNPPCILINGCLNLPPPKNNVQGNLWPVTQSKRSSFVQMCRKIKRSKHKHYEQASQYHPPYTDVQEYLPEYKTEKIVQSICNHEPPCEIVHGCYKVQYDPKLQNSCVHVPMCQYFPACLLSDKNKEIPNGSCIHQPKCAKLPICTRKYITLTAKEHVGTQVKPREKITCRHQPQCFLIPKCLAQAICGNYIPIGAIPDCVHQPCCEMIPACCRKSAKEMVSVQSQYPNACRVV